MKRVYWIDFARFVAILLVVFTHAHEQAGVGSITLKSLYYSVDRLGVPIFLMISGGLILPRLEKEIDIIGFYKKRIPQFVLIIVFYSIMTTVFREFFVGGHWSVDIKSIFYESNGIHPSKNAGAHHLWYMYTIIGLYIIAPFLARMLANLSNKEILLFCAISVAFNQLASTATLLGYRIEILQRFGNNFTGGYLVYLILGYLIIGRNALKDSCLGKKIPSLCLFIIPAALHVWYDAVNDSIGNFLHWYSGSMFILLSGIGLLLLIKSMLENSSREFKVISVISFYSFGIYLSHYAFIYMAKGLVVFYKLKLSEISSIMIYFMSGLVLGIIYSYLMSRNKFTAKLSL